ncbi:MAG: hypothetical protein IJR66_05300 [Clostridia bacterium]|nr:hypothetical protein [Clostridia bacterium]
MIEKTCSFCGRKLSKVYKTGYAGCPYCYREFKEELKPLIKEYHGSFFHTGKRPVIDAVDIELLEELKNYVAEKDRAEKDGRIEDVNKLNSLISAITEELKRRNVL